MYIHIQSITAKQQLDQLSKISGTTAKKSYLYANPGLLPYIIYAIDPRYMYHMKVPGDLTGMGFGNLTSKHFAFLDCLIDGSISGMAAKEQAMTFMIALNPESAQLFISIINKSMRLGLSTQSINQLFPGTIFDFKVMLASQYSKAKHKLIWPVFSSPKIDGVRAYYRRGVFYSRTGKVYKGLDHIGKVLNDYLPSYTELDGELAIPGLTFQTSCGQIRSDKPSPGAVYFIFDLPSYVKPLNQRLFTLKQQFESFTNEYISIVPHFIANDEESAYKDYYTFRNEGYEGSVLKNSESLYQRKRSMDWVKIKAVCTIDLLVVDTFRGKGKYDSLLGGAVCQLPNGNTVKVGSGFSDTERFDYADWPKNLIGHIIEIEYHELTPDLSLREPRYKGIRHDKQQPDDYPDRG